MSGIGRRAFLTGASLAAAGAAAGVLQPGTATAAGRPPHHSGPPAVALARHDTPGDQDFPKVGGNLGNQNYTALSAIHRGNIRKLGGAWYNRVEGGLESGNSQSSPVVVDGTIFIESALGNVIAVDGKTGVTKWRYEQTRGSVTRRGVAVGGGKVFTKARGNWVIALDQETGQVVWERQINGYGNVQKVAVTYHDGRLYLGTNDGNEGAALCVDANNGDVIWHFWGVPRPGEFGNDTWEGDSWRRGGATPWLHPAIDPELGLVYCTFGNARGSRSSQDGSERGGMNLFANSIVALDMNTGEYRWHFQSIHHGIWDMDNAMAPVLVDAKIRGPDRKLVVYGSKLGMYFILDRETGEAPLGIEERPVPQEPRQKTWPTQPFPLQGGWMEQELVQQPLGTSIPGDPTERCRTTRRRALRPALGQPVLTIPGHGGGACWNHQSYSQSTWLDVHRLRRTWPRPTRSPRAATGCARRASTDRRHRGGRPVDEQGPVEEAHAVLAGARQRDPHHGAADLLFIGQPDGNLLCLDARNGRELWRFQTGAAISSSPIMYEVDGEQYIAVYAGGTGIPYGESRAAGRLPVGVQDRRHRRRRRRSSAAGRPPAGPRLGPVEGSVVNNTVVLARTYNANTMQPMADGVRRAATRWRPPICGSRWGPR